MKQPNLTEIYRAIGRLEGDVKTGFKGIHQRLDTANGRLNNHGDRINDNENDIAVSKGKAIAYGAIGGIVISILGLLVGYLK